MYAQYVAFKDEIGAMMYTVFDRNMTWSCGRLRCDKFPGCASSSLPIAAADLTSPYAVGISVVEVPLAVD